MIDKNISTYVSVTVKVTTTDFFVFDCVEEGLSSEKSIEVRVPLNLLVENLFGDKILQNMLWETIKDLRIQVDEENTKNIS